LKYLDRFEKEQILENKTPTVKRKINPRHVLYTVVVTLILLEINGSIHPSLRSRFFYFLVGLQRFLTRKMDPLEKIEQIQKLEKFIEDESTAETKQANLLHVPTGIKVEWCDPETNYNQEQVILYLHGGAYVSKTPIFHRQYARRIATQAKTRALYVDYRLAPAHPFPAALEDANAAYKLLLESGFKPENIVIMGDSAGGGLAASTLVYLKEQNMPLPACAVLISPWLDLAGTGNSIQRFADVDKQLSWENLEVFAKSYYRDYPPSHPLISPLYANLSNMTPIMLIAGGKELLLDDTLRFADRLSIVNCEVELLVEPNMGHVFSIFDPLLPEAQLANTQAVDFIISHLNPSDD
jgi:acetyl esterase/lipase